MAEQMTPVQINVEIQKLRDSLSHLSDVSKSATEKRRTIEKEEEALLREYKEKLSAIQERRKMAQENVYAIESQINNNRAKIEDLQKLLAKLLEAQNELNALKEIEGEILALVEQFPALSKARPFQIEDTIFAVNAYKSGKNGILNANDMGLGKTYEATVALYILSLEFIKENGREPRVLWLTKKTLVKSSCREIKKWWPEAKLFPILEPTPQAREFMHSLAMELNGIEITNYETVRTTKVVAETNFDFVVIDEVHKLKGGANDNGPTKIWTAVKDVCTRARFTMMLSGTPMVNKPSEMWAYLHIFDPQKFPSYRRFQQLFTVPIYSWQSGGTEFKIDVDKLLTHALKGQVVRRRKDEVGIQLPSLTRDPIFLEMTEGQRKIYDQIKTEFFVWLDEQAENKVPLTATSILAQLTRLRQINVWPPSIKVQVGDNTSKVALNVRESSKIDQAMDMIEELNDAEEPVVVFCTFNEPLHEIANRCEAQGIATGCITGANSSDVGDIEKLFQEKKIQVLCVNVQMGEGLNLQKSKAWPGGASHIIFLDLWWTPAKNEQAEARVHRQGAIEPVISHVLYNEDSIDAFIAAKLEEKSSAFAQIMESKELRPASEWKQTLAGLL